MPKCENCGGDVPEGTHFCPQCGTPVSAVADAGAPTPPPAGVQPQAPPVASMPTPPGPPGVAAPPVAPAGPQPRQKKGMAKGAKIAIILAVSAIVLIILAVVLAVVFFANVISAPADVANDYVRALDAGELNTAWNHLSTGTQNKETRKGFEDKVASFKDKITRWNTTSININNDVAEIVMKITFIDDTKTNWNMTLIKEDGEWKIKQVAPVE